MKYVKTKSFKKQLAELRANKQASINCVPIPEHNLTSVPNYDKEKQTNFKEIK